MQPRIVVLDTETAGLDQKAGVVEIAIIEVDENFNTIATHHSLIDPEGPISTSASGVHGIVTADVLESPTLRQFFDTDELRDYCTDDLIVIGHNVPFDLRFLADELRGNNKQVCTLRLARFLFKEAENHKLATLRYELGLDAGEGMAHSALFDTILCLNLARYMAGELQVTASELADMCEGPLPVHRIPFGKHAGDLLHDIPAGYRRWLLGQSDVDRDLRHSLEALN